MFECDSLDERNWVMDFGGLKDIKDYLKYMFDHTTLVAKDDPYIDSFRHLSKNGIISLREVESVGCERFAKMIYKESSKILYKVSLNKTVRIKSVEVFEHGANSAIYEG